MKKVWLSLLSIFISVFLHAQQKRVGFNTSVFGEDIFRSSLSIDTKNFLFGLNAEYFPKNAIFSFEGGIQYLYGTDALIFIPLNINLKFGKKTKLYASGGFTPLYNTDGTTLSRMFSSGFNCKTGIEFAIKNKYLPFLEIGSIFLPTILSIGKQTNSYHKSYERNSYFSFGIKLSLSTHPSENSKFRIKKSKPVYENRPEKELNSVIHSPY